MSKRLWAPLYNTFLANTRHSFTKALTLFADTHAKLANEQTDPDIANMYNMLDPIFRDYAIIYANWQTVKGTYKGKTASLQDILENQMTQKLRLWEGAVRNVYTEDSPTEIEIFPNKRAPFLKGTYVNRIIAIKALADKLTEYAPLNALQIQVISFYNTLESIRLRQQEKEGDVKRLSVLLENQRIIVCETMYAILGLLMFKYKSNPNDIARFFDFSLIRRTK